MADSTFCGREPSSSIDITAQVEANRAASVRSTFSWNTFLSRTSVSSLSRAVFSHEQTQVLHGLEDVIRSVQTLQLRRYPYESLVREEVLGEGETYLVERCVVNNSVFAVKHLKSKHAISDDAFQRRLRSVVSEIHIMKHGPLQSHPNFLSVEGYGWNMRGSQISPYILVEYAQFGTLRQYFKNLARPPLLTEIEILVGDVASALSALHSCGVVHGDVKLDNVLVFPSWDRPVKVIAKLTDFGHALIMADQSKSEPSHVRYGGTFIYNAPEVHRQDEYPIQKTDLPRCDIWAFGLLLWESCLGGEQYLKIVEKDQASNGESLGGEVVEPARLLRMAKQSVPGRANDLGIAMFIRVTLHRSLQGDPMQRDPNGGELVLRGRWNVSNFKGLEADLALHLHAPVPTYEMFRFENGQEILWAHEERIFTGLKRAHAENQAKDISSISWQIALCYHNGFGVARNSESAYHYAKLAEGQNHPVAKMFADLLRKTDDSVGCFQDMTYPKQVSRLRRLFPTACHVPPLIKSCFDGDHDRVIELLLNQDLPKLANYPDGDSVLHWLFMLEDKSKVRAVTEVLRGRCSVNQAINLPTMTVWESHSQWPLQLSGTPLSTAISVNCVDTIRALLSLGADPTMTSFREGQYDSQDPRSKWTPLHLAVKYHCPEILDILIRQKEAESMELIEPLACALSYSTSLERIAMHGRYHLDKLRKTIALISNIHPLNLSSPSGRTALMLAIDFQDHEVVAALLEAQPGLASGKLESNADPDLFNFPIHFASQIAARRNTSETVAILDLINDASSSITPSSRPIRDSQQRTPLHLAVTGPSSLAASWILEKQVGLLQVEDQQGRTPLHCCASVSTLDLLISKGSNPDHTDLHGMTALHHACYRGELDIVQGLLKHKPMLHLNNNRYGTPLHCAVIIGSIDVVIALLDAGAPINAADRAGNTTAHVAARLNRYTIIRVLIQRGANIALRNRNGRDVLTIAARTGHRGSEGVLKVLNQEQNNKVDKEIFETADAEINGTTMFSPTVPGIRALQADFLWEENELNENASGQDATQLHRSTEVGRVENSFHDDSKVMRHNLQAKNLEFDRSLDSWFAKAVNFFDEPYFLHFAGEIINLMSIYFSDCLWNPPLSENMENIIAYTALDLSSIFRNTSLRGLGLVYHVHVNHSYLEWRSSRMTIFRNSLDLIDLHAAFYLALVLDSSKPSSVLSGRTSLEIGDMVLSALQRVKSQEQKRESDSLKIPAARFGSGQLGNLSQLLRQDLSRGSDPSHNDMGFKSRQAELANEHRTYQTLSLGFERMRSAPLDLQPDLEDIGNTMDESLLLSRLGQRPQPIRSRKYFQRKEDNTDLTFLQLFKKFPQIPKPERDGLSWYSKYRSSNRAGMDGERPPVRSQKTDVEEGNLTRILVYDQRCDLAE